jgi:hypothetical protein
MGRRVALILISMLAMWDAAPVGASARDSRATNVKVTMLSTMVVGNASAGIGEWGFAAVLEVDGSSTSISRRSPTW